MKYICIKDFYHSDVKIISKGEIENWNDILVLDNNDLFNEHFIPLIVAMRDIKFNKIK